jgi:hypothetical protein
MDHYREKKLREDYLVALLELHAGNYGADVDNRQACAKIGINYNGEATRICQHLRREELVTWTSFDRIALTPKGSREAERIRDARFQQKEDRIMDELYNSKDPDFATFVVITGLAHLRIAEEEMRVILNDLDERGFVSFADNRVQITRTGVRAVEARHLHKSGPGDNYTVNIEKLEGGVLQGPNSIQNIKITNHQPISEILPNLKSLIEAVKAEDFDDKDDVIRDLEKVREVALANPNATAEDRAWTRINAKLTAAKTSMELAGFVIKTYPYWPQVLEFFHRL